MNHLRILAALVAIVAVMYAPLADAENRTNDRKTKDVIQGDAEDVGDRAKTEEDQAKRHVKKHKDNARDAMEDESGDDAESEDSESDDSDHGKARHEATERGDRAGKGLDNAAGRGNEKSQEMRARRDERNAIKEEYKTGDKGEAIDIDDADSLDVDAIDEAESDEKKEKKPWWKFWNL
jgi:hypothetical protein